MQGTRDWQRRAIIAAISAIAAFLVCQLSPVRSFENFLTDLRMSHHPVPYEIDDQIVIIAIDDTALEGIAYTSPIHRGVIASVLQRLDNAKVRAVGIDIILDRPTEPALDDTLSETMRQATYPIILGEDPGAAFRKQICAGRTPEPPQSSIVLQTFLRHAELAHLVVCVEPLDEIVRMAPRGLSDTLPGFAEALHTASGGAIGGEPGLYPIAFRPSEEKAWPFPTYSAAHLDIIPDDWLRDKTILIGQISPYSGDFFSTPLRFNDAEARSEQADLMPRSELPGVVVHAFALAGLQTGMVGKTHTWASQIPYVLIGAVLGIFIVLRRWRLWATLAGIAAALVFFWWLLFAGFNWTSGVWLAPYCGLALSLLLSSGSTFALQEREERARRRWVQEGFAHFLSEERVQQLIASPQLLSLSAEEREISILFTDLEGFTTLVDTVPPAKLTPILNGYLDVIMEIVVKYDGTVDKIIGDAVHAMFSAPLLVPDHRLKATLCALDILEATRRYQADIAQQGIELGRTRIGISSGAALVGNFGSSKRFDYTSHGSVVNLAARLESENKVFGTGICVSAAAKTQTEALAYREIGTISVRGLLAPVQVFEPLKAAERSPEALETYAKALSLMEAEPERAGQLFEDLLADHADDGLVRYQFAKIRAASKSTN